MKHGKTAIYEIGKAEIDGYKPHGCIKLVSFDHGIKTYVAKGPFNVESFGAWNALNKDFNEKFKVDDYGYCSLITFEDSCLITRDVLEKIAQHHDAMSNAPQPLAVTYVITPDVEGYVLMKSVFTKFYEQINVPFAIYNNIEQAKQWLGTFVDRAKNTE